MERIAYYAVIELAVRLLAHVFQSLFDADPSLFIFISQIFAFFLGFLFQSIRVTFGVFGLGLAAILVVREHIFPGTACFNDMFLRVHTKLVIPPWPMFNQHPVTWLKPKARKEKQQ